MVILNTLQLISSNLFMIAFCCGSVYFLTIIFLPLIRKFGLSRGIVDQYDFRKQSGRQVVRLGGLAIVLNVIIFFIVYALSKDIQNGFDQELILPLQILCAAFFIFIIGFVDDIITLSPSIRLSLQVIISLLLCKFGLLINTLDFSYLNIEAFQNLVIPSSLGYIISILWLAGVTNAFNWVDGIDGLASGLGIISAIGLIFINFTYGNISLAFLSLLIVFALLGFLKYNFYPSSIYMGDGGSNFLGFTLASISLVSTPNYSNTINPLILISLFCIPVLDMALVIFLRSRAGKSPLEPDRRHLHHRLLNKGLSQKETVLSLYSVSQFILCITLYFLFEIINLNILICSFLLLLLTFNFRKKKV